jgi:4'-phosphopantetheinyl transferase
MPETHWELPPAPPDLPDGEVHLWRVPLDQTVDVVNDLRPLLAHDERARADRIKLARESARFVVGRGSLRRVLARYIGREPGSLTFGVEGYGKPFLVGNAPPRFNLSHSHGTGLIAVARERTVGVDLERLRPMHDLDQIVARFFAPGERSDFATLADDLKLSAFFRCWTRKEAYMKATGEGFSMPLERFEVSLLPGVPARLVSVTGRPEEVARWFVYDVDPGPDLVAAVVVERGAERLRHFAFEPGCAS